MARATDVRVEMLKAVGMPEALIGSAGAQVSLYRADNDYTFLSPCQAPRRRTSAAGEATACSSEWRERA